MSTLTLLLLFAVAQGGPAQDLVEVTKVNPSIRLDIRYATENNFTHHKVYKQARCFLQRPAAEQLGKVQKELEAEGLGLKLYDCYRPLSVQKKFWALVPDERYVADPAKGSRHNRGAAVDLTVVDRNGREIEMPTPYDNFTERAHRNFMNLPATELKNRALLERVMTKYGFEPLPTEWWHFDFRGWERYPVMDADFRQLEQPTRNQ